MWSLDSASEPSGNLLEMQILGPYSSPSESKSSKVGAQKSVFSEILQRILKFENHCPDRRCEILEVYFN